MSGVGAVGYTASTKHLVVPQEFFFTTKPSDETLSSCLTLHLLMLIAPDGLWSSGYIAIRKEKMSFLSRVRTPFSSLRLSHALSLFV